MTKLWLKPVWAYLVAEVFEAIRDTTQTILPDTPRMQGTFDPVEFPLANHMLLQPCRPEIAMWQLIF